MRNILIGVVFVIGGLSGKLVLRGTNDSAALVYVGIGLMVRGIFQVIRNYYRENSFEALPSKPFQLLNEELSKKGGVVDFFNYTLESWQNGKLDRLNPSWKNVTANMNYEEFTKIYGPYKEGVLEKLLGEYSPLPDEFLVIRGPTRSKRP